MRTTLRLDADVLAIAREKAEEDGITVGQAISILVRLGQEAEMEPIEYPEGFTPLAARPGLYPATLELVNSIRDETN